MGRGRGRRGEYSRSSPALGEIEIFPFSDDFKILSSEQDGITPTTFENAITNFAGDIVGGLFPRFIEEDSDIFQFAPSINPENSDPIDTATGARIEYKASRSLEDLSDYTVFYVEDEDQDISNGFQVRGSEINVGRALNDLDYILEENIIQQGAERSVFPIDIPNSNDDGLPNGPLANFPPEGFEIFSLQEDGITPTIFENAIELDGNVIGGLFPRFIEENSDIFQFAPSINPENSDPIDTATGARIEYKASRSLEDLNDYVVIYVEDEDGDISNGFQVGELEIDVDRALNDLDYILEEDILDQFPGGLRSVTTDGFFDPGATSSSGSGSIFLDTVDISLDTAFDDRVSVTSNQSVTIDVLENDLDVDNNGFELSVTGSSSQGGTITVIDFASSLIPSEETQEITYTPTDNFVGTDSFTYNLLQDGEVIETARVTVEVLPQSLPPLNPLPPNISFEPIFGSVDEDVIEVQGSNQLIFTGNSNDLVDAFIGEGNNRINAGDGNDTLILGEGDRVFGGDGSDHFFATSGGNNTLTGGEGADQFWIATAEFPDATNTVTDFTIGEDVIGIAGLGIGFEQVNLTQNGDDVLISTNGNDLALLEGIDNTNLSESDFTFA